MPRMGIGPAFSSNETITLDNLSDVTITSPTDDQHLMYDSATGEWINQTVTLTLDGLTDVTITSPADNEILAYDSSSGEWINQTAAEAGIGVFITDTKDNILNTSGNSGDTAISTDTGYLYIHDGTNWQESGVKFNTRSDKDMGIEQDSSLEGYHTDYLTDKIASNFSLGGSVLTQNGGLRIDSTQDPDTLEIYLRNAWQTIIYDLTTEDGDFRHAPVSDQIYVWSGNSVKLGLNGLPLTQQYQNSMGSNNYPVQLDGGTF